MALSRYLIQEKGFQAIAIEGDWTSVYAVHRYCQGYGNIRDAHMALAAFNRFPTWMWRNTTMLLFIQRLRQYNDRCKNKVTTHPFLNILQIFFKKRLTSFFALILFFSKPTVTFAYNSDSDRTRS